MVAVRDSHLTNPADFDAQTWTASLDLSAVEQAELLQLYRQLAARETAESTPLTGSIIDADNAPLALPLLAYGVEMVEILMTMDMDMDTLKVALLYPFFDAKLYDQEQIDGLFGAKLTPLLIAVVEMDAIRTLQAKSQTPSENQMDNLRRMLMAIVDDVRAIVIKLAERICQIGRAHV